MREIKFRAWDVSRERFQRGGSNLMLDMAGIKYWQFAFDAPEPLPREDGDKFILEQFTGLHDKNGDMIFEGDIVNFTYWWFDGQERESNLCGEIVYEAEHMSFSLRGIRNKEWLQHVGSDEGESDTTPFAFFNFDDADFEVIGNIHQNPELLESGDD